MARYRKAREPMRRGAGFGLLVKEPVPASSMRVRAVTTRDVPLGGTATTLIAPGILERT